MSYRLHFARRVVCWSTITVSARIIIFVLKKSWVQEICNKVPELLGCRLMSWYAGDYLLYGWGRAVAQCFMSPNKSSPPDGRHRVC